MRIQGDLLAEINWWHNCTSSFNGKSKFKQQQHITSVATDTCKEEGGGLHDLGRFYVNWCQNFPYIKEFHINELEAFVDEITFDYLMKGNQNNYGPGYMHILPKIHRLNQSDILKLEDNGFNTDKIIPPGRPIISQIGTVTEYI